MWDRHSDQKWICQRKRGKGRSKVGMDEEENAELTARKTSPTTQNSVKVKNLEKLSQN
jgi:hypothetical protein